jgi:hypothetical protein
MHWFDDFAKSAAGNGPSRASVLGGLASLVAGSALVPATSASAGAATPFGTKVSGGARVISGYVPKRKQSRFSRNSQRGACSLTIGPPDVMMFSAAASTLRITVRHETSGNEGRARAFGGRAVVEITDGGESLLHVEAQLDSGSARGATLSFRYGSRVRGASQATFVAKNQLLSGTIDGRTLRAFSTASGAPSSTALQDGGSMEIDVEPELRTKLSALQTEITRSLSTCRSAHRTERVRDVATHDPLVLHDAVRAVRHFLVAQANGLIPQYGSLQNSGVLGGEPQTPNCYDAVDNAGVDVSGCIAGAIAGGFLCPPCVAYAVYGCLTTYAAALAAFEAPGGACNQVGCNGAWSPGPKSCDTGTTCCGQNDCCAAGETCGPLGFCCPADAPVSCGSDYDDAYCCPPNTICTANRTCQSCPTGQVFLGGQCCFSICGTQCCQSQQATCNQATGQCVNPSFGTPAPTPSGPKIRSIPRCTRLSGTVVCHAPNADGTSDDLCCAPGLNCCSGTCCPPGQTCGGGNMTCGVWIR